MTFIRKILLFIFVYSFILSCPIQPSYAQNPPVMHVGISNTLSDGEKFKEFIKVSNLRDVRSFKSPLLDSNPVLDSALIARALVLANIKAEFDLVTIPNSAREREMLYEGLADIAGTTQWDFHKEKLAANCFFSDIVIPDGFFEKGLYTTKYKSESIRITSVKDLSKYSFAINKNWVVDWKTLEGLHPKTIYDTPTRQTMFSMVFNGRVDMTLQGFSANPDLSIEEGKMHLYPVKGVKIVLKGTRHFVINKKRPELYEALERGLKIMKADNSLITILRQSGFYNSATENWKILRVH
jgi:hypothetical protein